MADTGFLANTSRRTLFRDRPPERKPGPCRGDRYGKQLRCRQHREGSGSSQRQQPLCGNRDPAGQRAIDSDAQLSQALGTERDNLYAAYSSTVERLIRGDLKEVYTLVRNRQDGKLDCEIHYLIDEVKAQASREAAMKKALDNVDLDQKYADKIREHVNKRPDIE